MCMGWNIKYWICIFSAVILDQITKYFVIQHMHFLERINIIPHFFDLTLVYNTGAAFSFLADAGGWQKYLFFILTAVVSVWLIAGIYRGHMHSLGKFSSALIVGGAWGNILDRLLHGHVIDFLFFYYQQYGFPAFNVADCCITAGAIGLFLENIVHSRTR